MKSIKFFEHLVKRAPSNRQCYVLLVAIVILCGTFFTTMFVNYHPEMTKMIRSEYPSWFLKHRYAKDKKFSIKTEGCTIPALDPFDNTVKDFVQYPSELKLCPNANYSLLKSNNSHIWLNKEKDILIKYNITDTTKCCYKSFYRPNYVQNINSIHIDDRINYTDCIYFDKIIFKKPNDEYVRVTCFKEEKEVYDQFFLFAPLKNKTTYNRSKELSKDTSGYNVLVVGIDNVSRMNFRRTMPKTYAYLKEKGAVELMGYNKVGDNSFPNLVALLMGLSENELKKSCHPVEHTTYDDCPFVWHWYKEAGYYTAFAEDSSYLGTFNYLRDGFRKTPTDYYAYPFFKQAETYAGNYKFLNPYLCMNEHYFYKVLLNYIEQLCVTLKNSKLFGFFWETTISHDYINFPMVMDSSYEELLKNLESSLYLDKTVLFLISDHGIRWGPVRTTKQGYLEERLPMIYVLAPPSFRENNYIAFTNLIYNSHRLTTPFDMHETLLDLIDINKVHDDYVKTKMKTSFALKRGISLFLPIPTNRTCASAAIDDHWCTCHRGKSISVWSRAALYGGRHLVRHLNKLLEVEVACQRLELEDVIEAKEMVIDSIIEKGGGWKEYVLVVTTRPGAGIFEATVRKDGQLWSVIGTVSRLNFYGDQSRCIGDPHLKAYCYCS